MPVTQQSPMAVSGARYTFIAKEATVTIAGPFCTIANGQWSAGAITSDYWTASALTTDNWTSGQVTHDTSCN